MRNALFTKEAILRVQIHKKSKKDGVCKSWDLYSVLQGGTKIAQARTKVNLFGYKLFNFMFDCLTACNVRVIKVNNFSYGVIQNQYLAIGWISNDCFGKTGMDCLANICKLKATPCVTWLNFRRKPTAKAYVLETYETAKMMVNAIFQTPSNLMTHCRSYQIIESD